MGGGAVIAAAAAARRRRQQEVVDAFRLGGATSAERAKPIESLGLAITDDASDLVGSGVLVQGREPGTFYLDEAMYIANRDHRNVSKRVALVLLAIAAVVGIIAMSIVARSP